MRDMSINKLSVSIMCCMDCL